MYSLDGHIYCFSDGNLLWEKPFPIKHGLVDFIDVNNNGFKDFIVASELRDELGYSTVVCFEGQSGSLLWKEELLYAGGHYLGPVVVQGSTEPLLFVTQHGGTVSLILVLSHQKLYFFCLRMLQIDFDLLYYVSRYF